MFDGNSNSEPNYYPGGGEPSGPSRPSFEDMAGNMAGDAGYYAGAAKDKLGGIVGKAGSVKKYLPLVVVAVIALIIIFLVLSWFGSQQPITFSVKELDGGAISSARLTIKSGGSVFQGISNKLISGNYAVTLPPGAYEYSISSTGYKKVDSVSLTVPDSDLKKADGALVVSLEKDITAKITVVADEDKIYKSLPVTGTITITNNGTERVDGLELVAVSSSSDTNKSSSSSPRIDINFAVDTFGAAENGGEASVSFTANLAGTLTTIKDITKKIKIKGTNISADLKLSAIPSVQESSITFDPTKTETLQNLNLEAGVKATMANKISVKNNSSTIPLDNVRVEIKPAPGYEDALSWIAFFEPSTEGDNIKVIPTIPQNKGIASLTFYITPPKNAQVDDAFYGSIVFSSPSIDSPAGVSVPVEFKVKKGFSKFADLTLTAPSTISVACDHTALTCAPKPSDQLIKMKNTGTEALSNINIEIDANKSDVDCSWIKLNTSSIDALAPGEETIVLAVITPDYESTNTFANCYFAWSYNDPLQSKLVRVVASKPMKIQKT